MEKIGVPKALLAVAVVLVMLTFLVFYAYAYSKETGWDFTYLAYDGGDGRYAEIAVAEEGEIHVSQWGYYDTPYSLMHSNWTDEEPSPEPIYSFDATHEFQWASMAVDDEGVVHVFIGLEYEGVWYANDSGGQWEFAPLPLDDSYDGHATVDNAGNSHLVYCEVDTYDIVYATDSGGAWTTEVLYDTPTDPDSTPPFNQMRASVLGLCSDSQNRLHALLGVSNPQILFPLELVYAEQGASGWSLVDILEDYTVVGMPSMALADDGTAHVSLYVSEGDSYSSGDTYSIAHASGRNTSDSWNIEVVQEAGNIDPWSSAIAVSELDEVHISFFEHYYDSDTASDEHSLWYARLSDGAQSTQRVSLEFALGGKGRTSIAVDEYGNAHMVLSKLDSGGYSRCTHVSEKTSGDIAAESLAYALGNTALVALPTGAIAAGVFFLAKKRRTRRPGID